MNEFVKTIRIRNGLAHVRKNGTVHVELEDGDDLTSEFPDMASACLFAADQSSKAHYRRLHQANQPEIIRAQNNWSPRYDW